MFNKIVVDYYGAPTPVNQLASFHVPRRGCHHHAVRQERRWPRSRRRSATPTSASTRPTTARSSGSSFPQLTEERRKEYIKVAQHKAEDARISIRNIRRHAKDELDRLAKDGEAGEDDVHARREGAREGHPEATSRRSTSCSSTRRPSSSRSEARLPRPRPMTTDQERRRLPARARPDAAGAAAGAAHAGPAATCRRRSASGSGSARWSSVRCTCGSRRSSASWPPPSSLGVWELYQRAAPATGSGCPLVPLAGRARSRSLVVGVRRRQRGACVVALALTVLAVDAVARRRRTPTGYVRDVTAASSPRSTCRSSPASPC